MVLPPVAPASGDISVGALVKRQLATKEINCLSRTILSVTDSTQLNLVLRTPRLNRIYVSRHRSYSPVRTVHGPECLPYFGLCVSVNIFTTIVALHLYGLIEFFK